jgi:hypothetical protein
MSFDALTAIKCAQLLPMGVGGLAMVTDPLHGNVTKDFGEKFGFGKWVGIKDFRRKNKDSRERLYSSSPSRTHRRCVRVYTTRV